MPYLNYHTSQIDRAIYRFMPFNLLMELFRTSEFTLARTSKWDDPFENYIVSVRFKSGDGGTLDLALRHVVHGSCWTRKSVSDALWRIYSPDKLSVRIGSSPRLIGEALQTGLARNPRSAWFIGRVDYLPQGTIVKIASGYAQEILRDKSEVAAARSVLIKRRSFSHEDEVRVLVIDRHARSKGGLLRVRIDPHAMIRSVMIDSRTPPDVRAMYESHLRTHIGFKGRISTSTLYDLPPKLVVPFPERRK